MAGIKRCRRQRYGWRAVGAQDLAPSKISSASNTVSTMVAPGVRTRPRIYLVLGFLVCLRQGVVGFGVRSWRDGPNRFRIDPRGVLLRVITHHHPTRRIRLLHTSLYADASSSTSPLNQPNSNLTAIEEANEYRRRAKELLEEAAILQAELDRVRTKTEKPSLLDRLFIENRPMTGLAIARVLKEDRWSEEQALQAVDELYEQIQRANETERLDSMMECLLEGAELVDENPTRRWPGRVGPALRARVRERDRTRILEAQRQLALEQNATGVPLNGTTEWSSSFIPLWVPSSILPFLTAVDDEVSSDDMKTIRDKVLTGSCFFCTSSTSIPQAALFRGNLRRSPEMNETVTAMDDLQRRLDATDVKDRVQMFLLRDPEWQPRRGYPDDRPSPVILVVPKSVDPVVDVRKHTVPKVIALSTSLLCTMVYAISCYSLNPSFFESIVHRQDLKAVFKSLPLFAGLVGLQGVHEMAHVLVAKRRKIKIGLPIPLPSVQLGTFGCITPIRSFPKTRSHLLDFALSGPLVSMIVSLVLMIFGITRTVRAPEPALRSYPFVTMATFKSSFLVGAISSFLAPKILMMPLLQPIPIHPSFLVGYVGLMSSALNMLPIFRLDGGRSCTAIMGSRFGGLASAWTLLLMLSAVLSGDSSLVFAWGVMVLFFQRKTEVPVRDEITDVSDARIGTWIATLVATFLALAPFPGGNSLF